MGVDNGANTESLPCHNSFWSSPDNLLRIDNASEIILCQNKKRKGKRAFAHVCITMPCKRMGILSIVVITFIE